MATTNRNWWTWNPSWGQEVLSFAVTTQQQAQHLPQRRRAAAQDDWAPQRCGSQTCGEQREVTPNTGGASHPSRKGKHYRPHPYQQLLRTWLAHLSPQLYIWTKDGRAQFCQSTVQYSSVGTLTSLCPTNLPPFEMPTCRVSESQRTTQKRKAILWSTQRRPKGPLWGQSIPAPQGTQSNFYPQNPA